MIKMTGNNCDTCMHYLYEEESGLMICDAELDEDEMGRFLLSRTASCPYYRYFDEYKIVQKQN